MKYLGLIYKDIICQKSSLILLTAVLIVLSSIVALAGNITLVCILLLLFAPLIVEATIYTDQSDNWDTAILTAVSRKDVIRSKYLLLCILYAGALLVNVAVYVVLNQSLLLGISDSLFHQLLLLSIAYGLLYTSLSLPLTIKFGQRFSHNFSILLALIVGGGYGITAHFGIGEGLFASANSIPIGFAVVGIVCCAVSYFVSQRIYAKKEF